jgi:hypothetical protein
MVHRIIVGTCAVLVVSTMVLGQVAIRPAAPPAPGSLHALIEVTAGTPSAEAYARYGGDLERYWQVVESQRAGKTFEACVAWQENVRLRAVGDGRRILVTAAEGRTASAADLLLVDESGQVLEQIQCKLGWKYAKDALVDPKYGGMRIMTPADELEILRLKLAQREASAAMRGVNLTDDWQAVREAFDTGRLVTRTSSGAPLPLRAEVTRAARESLEPSWTRLSRMVPSKPPIAVAGTADDTARAASVVDDAVRSIDDAARTGEAAAAGRATAATLRTAARVAVPVALVIDAGLRVNEGMHIEERFDAGEITQQQREVEHARNAAGMAGGWGGALAGAKLGAMGGGAAGTAVAPGPGTGIGAGVGAVFGSIAGYLGGGALAEAAAGWAVRKIHATGTTVADVASRAWDWTADTTDSAWNGASSCARHAWRWLTD